MDAYVRYRPRYPQEVVEVLKRETGLDESWPIADLGSGTGLLTEIFLRNGNPVFGVEPNQAMREAGEVHLQEWGERFVSVDGSAEATTLEDSSVHLVTAGQAFHWFEPETTRAECLRILRQPAWVALIWNERSVDEDTFQRDYENLLQEHGTDYNVMRFQNRVDSGQVDHFFQYRYQLLEIPNAQQCDLEGIQGRLRSTSYTPQEGESGYKELMSAAEAVFTKHEKGGQVTMRYRTKIFLGQL